MHALTGKKKLNWVAMVHAFNSCTWEASRGQPGLQSKFQDRLQSYTEKPCLKKPKGKNKPNNNKTNLLGWVCLHSYSGTDRRSPESGSPKQPGEHSKNLALPKRVEHSAPGMYHVCALHRCEQPQQKSVSRLIPCLAWCESN